MTQLNLPPENGPSKPIDFWSSFRLFPLQFDEFSFKRWYIYLVGYTFITVILSVIWDIRRGMLDANDNFLYFGLAFNKSITGSLISNWDFYFWMVGFVFIFLLFNRWQKSIPITFAALLCERRIRSDGLDCDLNQRYQNFLKDYQQALMSTKRYLLMGILIGLISIMLAIWWIVWRIRELQSVGDPLLSILAFLNDLLLTTLPLFLMVYLIVVGGATMLITGWYIRKLTRNFVLALQPSHPDNCGGFKLLGDFSLATAQPILILTILLGLYGIGNVFQRILLWTAVANLGLVFIAIPLAIVAFFMPIWDIHLKMLDAKRKYEDEYADRIEKLEGKIYHSLHNGELEVARSAKEEIEILQVVHPQKISYPTWPFNADVLLIFLTPQIVPLLSLLVGLNVNGPVAEALKSFLSIFSSHPNP